MENMEIVERPREASHGDKIAYIHGEFQRNSNFPSSDLRNRRLEVRALLGVLLGAFAPIARVVEWQTRWIQNVSPREVPSDSRLATLSLFSGVFRRSLR